MLTTPIPYHPKEIRKKIRKIMYLRRMFLHDISNALNVIPRTLREYMAGHRDIPPDHWKILENMEKEAIEFRENEGKECKKKTNTDLSGVTTDYINKQIRMQEFCMGEIFLRQLADSPRIIVELQKMAGVHRQSASRKISEMRIAGVVQCKKIGNSVLVSLMPGVRRYLFANHWTEDIYNEF